MDTTRLRAERPAEEINNSRDITLADRKMFVKTFDLQSPSRGDNKLVGDCLFILKRDDILFQCDKRSPS